MICSARDEHAKLAAAGTALDQREKRDVDGELKRISESDGELATLEAKAARAKQDFENLRDDAEAQLAAAAQENLTPESLASTATLLDGLPSRIEELAADQAQLDKDAEDIAEQGRQLEAAKARLSELQARVGTLAQAHATANSTLEEYRGACGRVQDDISTALRQAANVGKALGEQENALRRMRDVQKVVGPLETGAVQAAARLQSAEEQLADIRSHDAARAAGIDLSPGDPCLICRRPLPDDYQPPAPADPDTLGSAERTVKKAKNTARDAESKLAKAQADEANARQEYEGRQSAGRQSQTRLKQASDDAAAAMRALAQRQWGDGIRTPGEKEFGAMLQAACARLSESGDDDQDKLLSTSARQLLGLVRAVEQALEDTAARAEDAARKGESDAARAADGVSLAERALDEASARLATAQKRHAAAQTRFRRDLTALPALVRDLIPATTSAVTPVNVDTAKRIIAERRGQLDARSKDRERATKELEKLAVTRRGLDQRRSREITSPLQVLATYLERWQDATEQALRVLPPDQLRDRMPTRPAAITAEAVSAYAAALVKAEAKVRDSVARAAAAAGKEVNTRLGELDTAAAGLRAGQQGALAVTVREGEQLLDLVALDPVVAAETSARDAARQYRAEQTAAQRQIQQAASLDTAIQAGQARFSAVNALHGLLADAKFHQYLRQTHARAAGCRKRHLRPTIRPRVRIR